MREIEKVREQDWAVDREENEPSINCIAAPVRDASGSVVAAVSVSVVHPFMGVEGWTFEHDPDVVPDPVDGARFLREIYAKADPDYTGRVTVPILWDKVAGAIVNNESREIIRQFDTAFDRLATAPGFYDPGLGDAIDAAIDAIYEPISCRRRS